MANRKAPGQSSKEWRARERDRVGVEEFRLSEADRLRELRARQKEKDSEEEKERKREMARNRKRKFDLKKRGLWVSDEEEEEEEEEGGGAPAAAPGAVPEVVQPRPRAARTRSSTKQCKYSELCALVSRITLHWSIKLR